MTYETFSNQVKRLQEVYGEKAYPPERQKLLWRTFQNDSNEVFCEAIDDIILTYRSTPMHKEIHDAITEARRRDHERKRLPSYGDGSVLSILQSAYNPANYEDESMRMRIKGRIKLVNDYTSGRLTKKQFDEGCDFYDKAGIYKLAVQ